MKLFAALAFASLCTPALAGVETPDLAGFPIVSGISVISGYDCTAKRVFVKIDDYPPLEAATGTERNDTVATCGKANTGFSLLYNFNVLPAGFHRMNVYSDVGNIAFGEFDVASYGAEFLRGAKALFTLRNFPRSGSRTTVAWDENLQNFRIDGIENAPGTDANYAGTYYGRMAHEITSAFRCGPVPPSFPPPTPGTFDLSVSATALSLVATFADRTCHAAGARATLGFTRSGAVAAIVASSDCKELDQVYVEADGDQLISIDYELCANAQIRAVR